MAFNRSIRFRRRRKKISTNIVELQLTSMMDVLVIIVVFLLKSYAASTNSFTTLPGLQMPISASRDIPADSLQVIITPEGVTFENKRILEFVQTAGDAGSTTGSYTLKNSDLAEDGRQITPLFDALTQARDKSELLRARSKARDTEGKPLPFEGTLAIQADKRVNYEIIRRIMYTSATAGYRTFRFLAMRRE